MTLRQKQSVFAQNIGLLIQFIYKSGLEVSIGEFMRTEYQQAEYYRTGRSKTMNSRHLQKLAGDFNFFSDGRLLFVDGSRYEEDIKLVQPIGEYWMSLDPDNVWGADWNRNHKTSDETFRDPYHFEKRP